MRPGFPRRTFLRFERAIEASHAQRLIVPARPADTAQRIAAALAGAHCRVLSMQGAETAGNCLLRRSSAMRVTHRLVERLAAIRAACPELAHVAVQRITAIRTGHHDSYH